ncbi:putative Proline--tRNA ligase [Blattamonas nauphoetae]|uniref:proline--tRNA ligase n=1 Tax=Blattamonas nauphoetae TaxID=2049346 RepID=A0ABQ9Y9A4_9EUKA|nr:putative Proline--tRNA ligase [Blattamonas nauphoetae]
MAQQKRSDLTFNISKFDNFGAWYEEILQLAEVVDKRTTMKGVYVMPPYGCFMHNATMRAVEDAWVEQDIMHANFPTLIPETLLSAESGHFAGFVPEVFWVTKGGNSDLNPKLALRPTSETIIYSTFANWVQSHRDLPLKVQQTCQVFRCETKDTSPLIRSREILWNEAHCAHATAEESAEQCRGYWVGYKHVFEDILNVTGLYIRRPLWDTFPGADYTDVLDIILPNGKVMQSASTHFLGQGFANLFGVKFSDTEQTPADKQKELIAAQKAAKKAKQQEKKQKKGDKKEGESEPAPAEEEKQEPTEEVVIDHRKAAWMSCAGISTRCVASVICVHGDDNGLVLPTAAAPFQIIIIPILRGKADQDKPVIEFSQTVQQILKKAGIRVRIDDGPGKPGPKFFHWEMKGVPCRIEIGQRDMSQNSVCCVFRDQTKDDKFNIPIADEAGSNAGFIGRIREEFARFDERLHKKAIEFQTSHIEKFLEKEQKGETVTIDEIRKTLGLDTYNPTDKNADKYPRFDLSKPTVFRVPFISVGHDGKEPEAILRAATGLEIRGYDPNEALPAEGVKCIVTGQQATRYVYCARAM